MQESAPRPIAGLAVVQAALHAACAQKLVQVEVDGTPVQDLSEVPMSSAADLARIELVRPTKQPPPRPRYLSIKMREPTDAANISKLMSGVTAPLRQQGATVRVRMEFDVQNPGGIDPTLIELNVQETFKQLGIEVTITANQ